MRLTGSAALVSLLAWVHPVSCICVLVVMLAASMGNWDSELLRVLTGALPCMIYTHTTATKESEASEVPLAKARKKTARRRSRGNTGVVKGRETEESRSEVEEEPVEEEPVESTPVKEAPVVLLVVQPKVPEPRVTKDTARPARRRLQWQDSPKVHEVVKFADEGVEWEMHGASYFYTEAEEEEARQEVEEEVWVRLMEKRERENGLCKGRQHSVIVVDSLPEKIRLMIGEPCDEAEGQQQQAERQWDPAPAAPDGDSADEVKWEDDTVGMEGEAAQIAVESEWILQEEWVLEDEWVRRLQAEEKRLTDVLERACSNVKQMVCESQHDRDSFALAERHLEHASSLWPQITAS